MALPAALLFSLLAAASAWAGTPDPVVVGHEPPPLTLKEDLETGHAWGLAMVGFSDIFKAHLKQVAASKPGRLYPGARVSVLGKPADGHFLNVVCGKPAQPCPEVAEIIERRVLGATLLRALPTYAYVQNLYDLDTFAFKPLGKEDLDLTKEYYPDMWERLYALAGARKSGSGSGSPAVPLLRSPGKADEEP